MEILLEAKERKIKNILLFQWVVSVIALFLIVIIYWLMEFRPIFILCIVFLTSCFVNIFRQYPSVIRIYEQEKDLIIDNVNILFQTKHRCISLERLKRLKTKKHIPILRTGQLTIAEFNKKEYNFELRINKEQAINLEARVKSIIKNHPDLIIKQDKLPKEPT